MEKTSALGRIENIVRRLHREKGWPVEKTAEGEWIVTVPFMDGGRQAVHATPRTDREGDALVHVWSVIGKRENVRNPIELLELNASLSYGACAFDGENVVIKRSHLVRDADVTEISKAISYIANKASELRRDFFKS